MGLLDGPMRQVADLLLGTLGGTVTLIKPNTGFDIETDDNVERDPGKWDDVPVQPFESFKFGESYDTFRASGSTIVEGDFKTAVAAKYLSDNDIPEPEVGWLVVKDGRQYRIKNVLREYSGDEVALYPLHCGV